MDFQRKKCSVKGASPKRTTESWLTRRDAHLMSDSLFGHMCVHHVSVLPCDTRAVLGTPTESDMDFISSSKARTFLTQPPIKQPCDFATLYPGANPLAIDLLAKSAHLHRHTHTHIQPTRGFCMLLFAHSIVCVLDLSPVFSLTQSERLVCLAVGSRARHLFPSNSAQVQSQSAHHRG